MATTKLSEDILVSNYTKYKKRLNSYIGEDISNSIIEALGGEDAVMRASFATTQDTGLAYEGSLCKALLNITAFAIKINDLLPEAKRADKNSIVKVVLLSGISKVVMFKPNDDEWSRNKRGVIYSFNDDLEGALRACERSIMIAMNAGVKFTDTEYEAMRIMDKSIEDDGYSRYRAGVLSTVVRQAYELITLLSKKL